MIEKHGNSKGRAIIGSLLIILGLLFILDNYNVLDYDISYYVFRWESFLIFIGIVLVVSDSNSSTGVVLIAIAVFFLSMDSFNFAFSEFIYAYWPILVILFGFYILYQRSEDKKQEEKDVLKIVAENTTDNDSTLLKRTTIFSDESISITSDKFSLSNCFLLFSSLKFFFNSKQTNKSILLNNTLILSELELIIPSNWKVIDKSVNILGELKDYRRNIEPSSEKNITVIIKGAIILGSIKIREL